MTNIILLVSILLNGIALFCIVILYLRQNKFLQVEKKYEKLLREMEEVISTYLIEMTEENEKFIQKVKDMLPKHLPSSNVGHVQERDYIERSTKPEGEDGSLDIEKETLVPEKEIKERPMVRKGTVFQAVQAYKNTRSVELPQQEEVERPLPPMREATLEKLNTTHDKTTKGMENTSSSDLYAQSFYYQALLLQKQGLSTEEIAKRLNKGKTEIELLLKLRLKDKE